MPILAAETDIFPHDVLDADAASEPWWAIYTRSRQEKQLMRLLRQAGIGHFAPMIARRQKSPAGRIRTSYLPLFPNYVFVRGDNDARYQAVCTGTVSRCIEVEDVAHLVEDLGRIRRLIETGASLAPEARIDKGARVRVRTGQFAGFEGLVLKRHGETRLLVDVRFMNQGASVLLEDCQVDPI